MKNPQWRKSSYSMTSAESDCVELAALPAGIGVRDSKRPHAGHLSLGQDRFAVLLHRLKEMP